MSPYFQKALDQFDKENANDPNLEVVEGKEVPHELLDAQRLFRWVEKLKPEASEALLLASRCQHICRWEILRSSYPEGRAGYLKWRQDLKLFHADRVKQILQDVGYDEITIERVREFNLKENLKTDSEMQVLEDALCLVFLEFEFAEFCKKKDEKMMIRILKKTWLKMSPQGQAAARELSYNEIQKQLLQVALNDPEE